MKEEAELYKEYCEWVKKQNEPGLKIYEKMWMDDSKRHEEAVEKYEARKLEKKKKEGEELEAWNKWQSLPFWKKWFAPEPSCTLNRRYYRDYDYYPMIPPFFTYIPHVHETYEGFLRWLSEYKYKDA